MKNTKNGETLINSTKHKAKTNSIGFCFFNTKDFEPEKAMHFMSGVVSFDILAVFETNKKLNKTHGIYAEPIKPSGSILGDILNIMYGFNDKFEATEYCTTKYSNKDFKLIKYSENLWEQWEPRKEQSKLVWKKDIQELI